MLGCHREASEVEKIVEWLSPWEFKNRQEKLFPQCFIDVDEWFLQHEAFEVWKSGGRPWYLRCFGEQGSGKVDFLPLRPAL